MSVNFYRINQPQILKRQIRLQHICEKLKILYQIPCLMNSTGIHSEMGIANFRIQLLTHVQKHRLSW
jgi:hypothetical protein